MHFAIMAIYLCIFLVFLLCAAGVWHAAKAPGGDVAFGVTLPPAERDSPEVKREEKRFQKLCHKWGAILTLTFLPVPLLLTAVPDRVALSAVYLMVWAVVVAMYCVNRPVIIVFRSLRELKRKKASEIDRMLLPADDDDYWKESWFAGLAYCNPNDSSVLVEKRFGSGMTMNVATKKGKAFCYGGMAFAVVLIAVLSVFLLVSDFSATGLRVDPASHTVSIDAAFYGTKFSAASIQSVAIVDSIPKTFRTNGSDDGYTATGHFTVDGYGPSLLYVHENRPPYLVIRLPDKYVFYNEATKERTEAVYRELKAASGR